MEQKPPTPTLPRLQFPRIVKWGCSYEFPYPHATLKELFCLLKRGGNIDTFLGKDYATCSLIIHAIKENHYKHLVIFFKNKRDRHIFNSDFKRALRLATILFEETEGQSYKDNPIEYDIVQFDEEYLKMKGGFECEFFVADRKFLRGISLPTPSEGFCIIHGNRDDFSDHFTQNVLTPLLTSPSFDTTLFELKVIYNDEATSKRGRGLCIGGKAHTLQLFDITGGQNIKCESTCRSCAVKHETWEDELKQREENDKHLDKLFTKRKAVDKSDILSKFKEEDAIS